MIETIVHTAWNGIGAGGSAALGDCMPLLAKIPPRQAYGVILYDIH